MRFHLADLLSHRLLIVSGKGGVGKTTLSLALSFIAAQNGKRVLLAEINSEEQVAHLLERPEIGYREIEILPNICGINIEPRQSFEEYVLKQIKFKKLYKVVFENRLVKHFIEATPGLSDLMTIGKLYSLVDHYDLVIADAPATGHGIALLEIASVVANAVRIGPLKSEASKINDLLHDPKMTQVVLATLPEEMPITETLDLSHILEKKMNLSVGPFFLNQFQKDLFSSNEKTELSRFIRQRPSEDPLRNIVDLQFTRTELSEEYTHLLEKEAANHPIIKIPFIYSQNFGLTEIQQVADQISREQRNYAV